MYFNFTVEIPNVKGKIYEKTIKGVVYVNYEYDGYTNQKRNITSPKEQS